MCLSIPQRKRHSTTTECLLRLYSVTPVSSCHPEKCRNLLVPAHHDDFDHAAPKATVKVVDGYFLVFEYLDEVRQLFALHPFVRMAPITSSYRYAALLHVEEQLPYHPVSSITDADKIVASTDGPCMEN